MFKKTILLGMIITALLLSSMQTVNAADIEETIDDAQGDVIVEDENGSDTTSSRPNIDIKSLTYSRNSDETSVSVTLEVKGSIQNRGDLFDLNSLEGLIMISYSVSIQTDAELYELTYVNQKCQLTYSDYSSVNITDFSVEGGVLNINFNLKNSSEVINDIAAITFDIPSFERMYYDDAPTEIVYEANVNGPYEGIVGESIEFKGSIDEYSGTPTGLVYEWDFGDGTTSSQQNPTHVYDSNGTYIVTLTVTDSTDQSESDTTNAIITEDSSNGNSKSNNNDPVDKDDESNVFLFVGLIAMVVVIGMLVLFFVLKR